MLPRHTLLALSLLIALGTVAHGRAPYYSNGYSQSQYDSNRGDGRYGHRDGISYGGYGNSNADADGYGRPALDIGVPASQPPVCRGDVTVTEGLIIDIRLSDELGADLLSGVNEQSFESCVSRCCMTSGCDMAVFKRYGLSSSKKNCYLVQCGKPENCKMVRQEGFATATLSTAGTFGGKDGAGLDHVDQPSPGGEDQLQPPVRPTLPLTRTTTPPTEDRATEQPLATAPKETTQTPASATSTPATTSDGTEASPPGETQPPPGSELLSDVGPTEERTTLPNTTNSAGPDSETTSPDSVPVSDPTESDDGNKEIKTDGDSSEVTDDKNGTTTTGEDSSKTDEDPLKEQRPVISSSKGSGSDRDICGESGCNGASIIPVAVIGAISVVMLVVVIAVVLRKVVAIRRRRKFRNVDYLINGMYT